MTLQELVERVQEMGGDMQSTVLLDTYGEGIGHTLEVAEVNGSLAILMPTNESVTYTPAEED